MLGGLGNPGPVAQSLGGLRSPGPLLDTTWTGALSKNHVYKCSKGCLSAALTYKRLGQKLFDLEARGEAGQLQETTFMPGHA